MKKVVLAKYSDMEKNLKVALVKKNVVICVGGMAPASPPWLRQWPRLSPWSEVGSKHLNKELQN